MLQKGAAERRIGLGIKKVGFQGEHGAFSEKAALGYFGNEIEAVPCLTVGDVFEKISTGEIDFGAVPVENTIGGNIYETYDSLAEGNATVIGEIFLKIEHSLIGFPGTSISDLRHIYSHPQAIEQCREFLNGLNARKVSVYDTAGAVRKIKEEGIRDSAAIADASVAAAYGLDVLRKGIEGRGPNLTRFLIVSKKQSVAGPEGEPAKTSLCFAVKHSPGSLYRAIRPFAERKINLTKIESRPRNSSPWEYYFFLDFEGSIGLEECAKAVAEMRAEAEYVKILGSYRRGEVK